MDRPADLPDFEFPPINEVVFGVQFSPIPGYTLIQAGRVWEQFKDVFPLVREQPAISPTFETFGGSPVPQNSFSINLGGGVEHPRFWFLSAEETGIIQFQADRLLRNWRQVDGRPTEVYPSFSLLADEFEEDLVALEKISLDIGGQPLLINQVELSYMNRIYGSSEQPLPQAHDWLRLVNLEKGSWGDFTAQLRRVVEDKSGRPVARLYCETGAAYDSLMRPNLALNFTYRGAPRDGSITSALDFLADARDVIVRTFTEITTESAHAKWGRIA